MIRKITIFINELIIDIFCIGIIGQSGNKPDLFIYQVNQGSLGRFGDILIKQFDKNLYGILFRFLVIGKLISAI